MSAQRFALEVKEKVVKQVTAHGHSVAEVAARLGVSTHCLYKWVKPFLPADQSSSLRNYSKPRAKSCGCAVRCAVSKNNGIS